MAIHNDKPTKCDCDYHGGHGMATDIVLCNATNQWQVARQPDACLHLLRLSRLQGLPQQYIKRRTVKPTRVKTFR